MTRRNLLCQISALLCQPVPLAGQRQPKDEQKDRNLCFNNLVDAMRKCDTAFPVIYDFLKAHEKESRLAFFDIKVFAALQTAEDNLTEMLKEIRHIRKSLGGEQ